MFYSHQLLSRKAPLGQIWMAATMQTKLNRRVLSRIDIINVCEQILNPSVPLALRLSGILMGGVVIVFNRKVKFLYEDVNRLLMEINAVWRNAATRNDPTLLPKEKNQAKYETVTLKNDEATLKESFRHPMRLDEVELQETEGWEGGPKHQADPINITLVDDFPSYQDEDEQYHGTFGGVDIFAEEEGNMPFFNPPDRDLSPDMYATLRPTPGDYFKVGGSHRAGEFQRSQAPHQEEGKTGTHSRATAKVQENNYEGALRKPRKRGKRPAFILDYDLIIPAVQYQSWLQNPSDILCTRRSDNSNKKRKLPTTSRLSAGKFSRLMEMPMAGVSYKIDWASSEIFYPIPLLELWRKCLHVPTKDIPDPTAPPPSTPPPPPPGLFWPSQSPGGGSHQNGLFHDVTFEDMNIDIEVLRAKQSGGVDGSSRSMPGGNMIDNSDGNSSFPGPPDVSPDLLQRSTSLEKGSLKRKTFSSAGSKQGSSLEKVLEADEGVSLGKDTVFKMKRVCENGTMDADLEQLEETLPTQTPVKTPRVPARSVSKVTHVIASRLKEHFETPGTDQIESLNNLTYGMDRRNAAKLFYQICVMDSTGLVVAKQAQPYGDILIARGVNM